MRTIQNVIAMIFLVLSVSILALWIQSHIAYGVMQGPVLRSLGFYSSSWKGQLRFGWLPLTPNKPEIIWDRRFLSKKEVEQVQPVPADAGILGFHADSRPPVRSIAAPHWFLVAVTGAIAILLKPKPRMKFTVKDLLQLTVVVAIVFCVVAIFLRMPSFLTQRGPYF